MMQETLFETPVLEAGSVIPPTGIKHTIVTEPLGTCCKCGAPARLSSPSGKYAYCKKCGCCNRKESKMVKGTLVTKRVCWTSVDKFVKHPRLDAYVCPCVLRG